MKQALMAMAAVFAAGAATAAPSVTGVTMTQDDATRLVAIDYTLSGEPAIVTIDIQTNGVSIGGRNLRYFSGDVNKKLDVGAHSATWMPRKAWPGHKIDSGVTAVVTAWATNCPPDYLVTSLVAQKSTRFYADEGSLPYDITNDLFKTEYLVMRKIPAGGVLWRMGSPTSETGRQTNGRETSHLVALSNDFYIGVFELTQRQYMTIKGSNPSNWTSGGDKTRPVERVSWETARGGLSDGYAWPANGHEVEASSFFGLLRKHTGINSLDLPLEAQWEFACRAGKGDALYTGNEATDANLEPIAWYSGNSSVDGTLKTHSVGLKDPNDYGLYDMIGNVWEWCLDAFQTDITGCDPNQGAAISTNNRVSRGCCYNSAVTDARIARRSSDSGPTQYNHIGFRIACAAEAD